jgi:nickel transport protein
MLKILILSTGLFFAIVTNTLAHGVSFEIIKSYPAITVRATYEKAEPLSYASIKVYSPQEPDQEYQNARTDKLGYFAFVPKSAGDWKIAVDDELGHAEQAVIKVSEAFLANKSQQTQTYLQHQSAFSQIPIIYRIILGLSLIFGFTGLMFWYKTKQSISRTKVTT